MLLAETSTSIWHYHLVDTDEHKAGSLTGICGKVFVGWTTEIPLAATKREPRRLCDVHLCAKCRAIWEADDGEA